MLRLLLVEHSVSPQVVDETLKRAAVVKGLIAGFVIGLVADHHAQEPQSANPVRSTASRQAPLNVAKERSTSSLMGSQKVTSR